MSRPGRDRQHTNLEYTCTCYVRIIAQMKEVFQWIAGSDSLYIIENAVNPKPVTERIAIKDASGSQII